jgi:hypothetical protein
MGAPIAIPVQTPLDLLSVVTSLPPDHQARSGAAQAHEQAAARSMGAPIAIPVQTPLDLLSSHRCLLINRPGQARHKRMSRQQRAAWVRP